MTNPAGNSRVRTHFLFFISARANALALLFLLGFCSSLVFAGTPWIRPAFVQVDQAVSQLSADELQDGFGSGIAAADFDADGWVDVFVPTAAGSAHKLFRNLGDGTFMDVAPSLGLDLPAVAARVALWADVDGDQRLDLILAGDCFRTDCAQQSRFLYLFLQQTDGQFADASEASGLVSVPPNRDSHRSGLAAGDFNRDGRLDLVSGFWMGEFQVFINQPNGGFDLITLADGPDAASHGHWQPVIVDLDGDGWLDIYWSVDFGPNEFWRNLGNNPSGFAGFERVSDSAGCDNDMNDMGVAVGDVDNDGDPDLYVTNIFREGLHNVLLTNTSQPGQPGCEEIATESGVADGGWGWGAAIADFDRDGLSDIAETNGWRVAGWEQPIRLFMNQQSQPGQFVDQAQAAGLDEKLNWGSSLLALDFDLDGDLDLFQSLPPTPRDDESRFQPVSLFEDISPADAATAAYLLIRPRQSGSNHFAIGAKISITAGGQTQTRFITAGDSFLGQHPAEGFFGLGTASVAEEILVQWPGGGHSRSTNVPVNQVLTIQRADLLSDGFESSAD